MDSLLSTQDPEHHTTDLKAVTSQLNSHTLPEDPSYTQLGWYLGVHSFIVKCWAEDVCTPFEDLLPQPQGRLNLFGTALVSYICSHGNKAASEEGKKCLGSLRDLSRNQAKQGSEMGLKLAAALDRLKQSDPVEFSWL